MYSNIPNSAVCIHVQYCRIPTSMHRMKVVNMEHGTTFVHFVFEYSKNTCVAVTLKKSFECLFE